MKWWLKVGMILCIVELTGCTGLNSKFDCPNQAGVRCKSLDQINSMVDSGQIRGRSVMNDVEVVSVTYGPEFEPFYFKGSTITGRPIRYPETIQRIWIAPYEDTEGNFHQDSFIYSVMSDGHWKGNPIKTIRSS